MSSEEAEKQKRAKYEHHDFSLKDLSSRDLEIIKSVSIRDFVQTSETSVPILVIQNFMAHLKNHGFRITKVEKK